MKTMKKMITVMALLITALALMGAVSAYAQGPDNAPAYARGGPCREAGLVNVNQADMHAAIADVLGISVTEFEAMRYDEGKSLYLIASELDVDIDAVRAAMNDVREAAIDEALAAGTITAEQAEWMRARPGAGGYAYGYGQGPQDGAGNRMQGRWQSGDRQINGKGVGNGFGGGNGGFNR